MSAAVFIVWAIVVASTFGLERASLRRDENKAVAVAGVPGRLTRRFEVPGLARPPAVTAETSGLAEGEEVIGVVVGGRPRAYRLGALAYPPWHVVNDVVGGVPVTIAHCDLSGCTQAFAGEPGSRPLDVSQAGVVDGEMVVRVDGVAYWQRTGMPVDSSEGPSNLPYPHQEWTRTTWREWKQRHPATDVFVGVPGSRAD